MALESCEFWSAFCEASVEPGVLQPFLGRLIPVLLKNMVYDEYDEEVGEAEAAEEAALSGQAPAEDREQEVKPFIARCGSSPHMCWMGTPGPWTQLLVFGALLDFVNLWAAPCGGVQKCAQAASTGPVSARVFLAQHQMHPRLIRLRTLPTNLLT